MAKEANEFTHAPSCSINEFINKLHEALALEPTAFGFTWKATHILARGQEPCRDVSSLRPTAHISVMGEAALSLVESPLPRSSHCCCLSSALRHLTGGIPPGEPGHGTHAGLWTRVCELRQVTWTL